MMLHQVCIIECTKQYVDTLQREAVNAEKSQCYVMVMTIQVSFLLLIYDMPSRASKVKETEDIGF